MVTGISVGIAIITAVMAVAGYFWTFLDYSAQERSLLPTRQRFNLFMSVFAITIFGIIVLYADLFDTVKSISPWRYWTFGILSILLIMTFLTVEVVDLWHSNFYKDSEGSRFKVLHNIDGKYYTVQKVDDNGNKLDQKLRLLPSNELFKHELTWTHK